MDIRTLLLGEEEWSFLWIIPLRAAIIFSAVIIMLRLIGKRAIPQGIFEVLIIVIIGSAAGDPLIYNNVGILPAIIAFGIVALLYKVLSYLVGINRKVEHFVEDSCVKLIAEGRFEFRNFSEKELKKDELLADLRLQQISQLGQVRAAYIEANGHISVFYCPDAEVRPGLPILPDLLDGASKTAGMEGEYACLFCGEVMSLKSGEAAPCRRCEHDMWLPASRECRVQ
jgi:uncharacterized membrane protein YcaP (DUF421 family)